ncbi:MAG: hypothetical protein LBE84_04890 [Planctomycetota bacterium]|jgi:hypothetical protein|nr:hypothetical protein [Planctomycetota bacterium]
MPRRLFSFALFALPLLALPFLVGGCSPSVVCVVETEVFPDYACRRAVRMDISPNPGTPQDRPRLGDYFQLPPAEYYESYAARQDGIALTGTFPSYEQMPSDLVRHVPGTRAKAENVFSFRLMDTVLFVLADFDETLTDIVAGEDDARAALTELVRLAAPEIMAVLNARYGSRRDLSRLDAWLNQELPLKLSRILDGAWRIHAAKRSGVTSPGEEYEYYLFLMAEAKREGLELAQPGTPDLWNENLRRLKEYSLALADRLCPPRSNAPSAPAGAGLDGASPYEILAALQGVITARHGSINAFAGKLAALAPRAFGAYILSSILPFLKLPTVRYHYRLRLPGQVIQTNGVREINGDLVWNFGDHDLAFTGQSMWARTIFIRERAASAVGAPGFPASLADVDRLFSLCVSPAGAPRESLLDALAKSADAGNPAPLKALADNPSDPDSAAARGALELFERHRQARDAASRPPAAGGNAPAASIPAERQ